MEATYKKPVSLFGQDITTGAPVEIIGKFKRAKEWWVRARTKSGWMITGREADFTVRNGKAATDPLRLKDPALDITGLKERWGK